MTEPKVLLDAQLEVLQGYAEDRDLPQMVGVLKEARAQLDALAAEVENAITNTLEAQAKSRIDEEQCDRMTEDAGNMAMKIKRLREALGDGAAIIALHLELYPGDLTEALSEYLSTCVNEGVLTDERLQAILACRALEVKP
jgi:hypothetical protein